MSETLSIASAGVQTRHVARIVLGLGVILCAALLAEAAFPGIAACSGTMISDASLPANVLG